MKTDTPKSWLSFNFIVTISFIWAILTFYSALAFGIPLPGQEVPKWYLILIYVFEEVAYLGAALLCLRNWRYRQIVSDRLIWLFLGLGLFIYWTGNLLFAYWDLVLERYPDVSLADFFYITSYLFLLWSLLLAIKSRGINLKAFQWGILAIVAIVGIWLGWLIATPSDEAESRLIHPTPASTVLMASSQQLDLAQDIPDISGAANSEADAPAWVIAVEETLNPLVGVLSLLYVINDVLLLILSATLLLTFWGGRFSRTWALIAGGSLLLYIADIRYAYLVTRTNYEIDSIIDTFWTLSAILFVLGAALEYEISSPPRRLR